MELEEFQKRVVIISESLARVAFMISHLAKQKNIQVSLQELNHAIDAQKRFFPGGAQAAEKFFKENETAKKDLMFSMLEDKVLHHLISECGVNTKQITLKELFDINLLNQDNNVEIVENKPKKQKETKKITKDEAQTEKVIKKTPALKKVATKPKKKE